MTTRIASLNCDPAVKAALIDIASDLAALSGEVGHVVTDVTALAALTGSDATIASVVTTLTAAVADAAAFVAGHNTTGTELNGSAGAADTDYAVNLAKTAVNPTASTVAAAAVTATALVADLATFATAFNTMSTKLNADATIDDTDYVTGLAKTAAAPVSTDIDSILVTVGAILADITTFRTAFNTRQTKIAADAAGTYAALAAVTAVAPTVASAISVSTVAVTLSTSAT